MLLNLHLCAGVHIYVVVPFACSSTHLKTTTHQGFSANHSQRTTQLQKRIQRVEILLAFTSHCSDPLTVHHHSSTNVNQPASTISARRLASHRRNSTAPSRSPQEQRRAGETLQVVSQLSRTKGIPVALRRRCGRGDSPWKSVVNLVQKWSQYGGTIHGCGYA